MFINSFLAYIHVLYIYCLIISLNWYFVNWGLNVQGCFTHILNIQLVSEWVHLLWFNYLSAILDPLAKDEAMEKVLLNCGWKSLFKSLKEKVGDYVTFDDGSHAQVLSKGTIEILRLPLLKDVLYIKGLKANLLSITQICDEDFLVQFSKKGCIIIDE